MYNLMYKIKLTAHIKLFKIFRFPPKTEKWPPDPKKKSLIFNQTRNFSKSIICVIQLALQFVHDFYFTFQTRNFEIKYYFWKKRLIFGDRIKCPHPEKSFF